MTELRLNRFLRGCIDNGIDFSRIRFVRNEYHRIWEDYFDPGKSVSFVKNGGSTFLVSGTGRQWVCNPDAGDCELLSIDLTHRGVLVTLGKGFS